jgi:hypothetical protein
MSKSGIPLLLSRSDVFDRLSTAALTAVSRANMLEPMKTTVDIPDSLLRQAEIFAAHRHTSLKSVINEALLSYVGSDRIQTEKDLELHTVRGNGLQKGLNWNDWSTVAEMIYQGRGTNP